MAEGTEWVIPWLIERVERWHPVAVAVQGNGAPASSLLDGLKSELPDDLTVAMGGADMARACGLTFDSVAGDQLRHRAQEPLNTQVLAAQARPLSDAWVIDRKKSTIDVAGLVAVTQALWALATRTEQPADPGIYVL